MKIRNGFVSNSSSSSFVVAFDREIKDDDETVNYLIEKLFEGRESHGYYTRSYETRQVAQAVARDLKPVTTSALVRKADFDEIRRRCFEGTAEEAFALYCSKLDAEIERQDDWSYNADDDKEKREFAAAHPDSFIYEVEWGDDTDFYGMLEHSGVFDEVPHRRFSHH